MPNPDVAMDLACDEVVAAPRPDREADLAPAPAAPRAKWEVRHDLERHRAETERLRVLVEFLSRPLQAHGGVDADPDIISAYNLAVESALHGIRRGAHSG